MIHYENEENAKTMSLGYDCNEALNEEHEYTNKDDETRKKERENDTNYDDGGER